MSKTPDEMAIEYLKEEYGDTSSWTYMGQEMVLDAFVAGYQAAKDQLADTSKVMNSPKKLDSWISVKERLPPPQTEVLWWNKAAHQAGVSSWEYMSYCDDTMIEWGDAGNVSIKNFTHWMPLPEAPKEEG